MAQDVASELKQKLKRRRISHNVRPQRKISRQKKPAKCCKINTLQVFIGPSEKIRTSGLLNPIRKNDLIFQQFATFKLKHD